MRFIIQALSFTVLLLLPEWSNAQTPRGQISVTGRGDVTVVPDMARISLGVAHEARSAAAAMELMSDAMAAVLAKLSATGIAAQDVQTSQLQLNPLRVYNNENGTSQISGYRASSNVTIRVYDLDALGRVLDAAVQSGANEMRGLQFDVAEPAPHKTAARELAVANARGKAGVFASAAGVDLGPLLSLAEGAAVGVPVMMEMSLARGADVPIAAGDMVISADVTMVYAVTE